MRSPTRRQQIEGEHRREQLRFILLAVGVFALIIAGFAAMAKRAGCGCAAEEPTPAVSDTQIEEPEDELRLSDEDVAFLRSVTEYPRLVNNDNPLPGSYEPPELTRLLGMPDGAENRLNYDAARAFYLLRDAMIADGIAIMPLSGYRTYDEQVSIFNYNVQLHTDEGMTPEEAREYTLRFVAFPGTSEHQYGRSIDVTIDGTTNHQFDKTEQGQWLIEHSHEFGFVVRYPSDKESITGIGYEPWHLRWVGETHAEFMQRHDLCLEEYVQLVLQYSPGAVSAE